MNFLLVSLFTREWIEMKTVHHGKTLPPSPSSRGSGLKFDNSDYIINGYRSPSSRGSGLKSCFVLRFDGLLMSPSSRGSGLKCGGVANISASMMSPSSRGSGLKLPPLPADRRLSHVSLFTREWIEIAPCLFLGCQRVASPSSRGSGLK